MGGAMLERRGSGILLHISSLPSPFGIGDMGEGAYRFVDFLAAAGQRYWQILPVHLTAPYYDIWDIHLTKPTTICCGSTILGLGHV